MQLYRLSSIQPSCVHALPLSPAHSAEASLCAACCVCCLAGLPLYYYSCLTCQEQWTVRMYSGLGTCCVCYNHYSLAERVPIGLPCCGNTVCKACSLEPRLARCPLCREALPDCRTGRTTLKINFALRGVIELAG